METGKIFSEIGKYVGSGILFKDHAMYAFLTIIIVTLINTLYKYQMRKHRITSEEYIDENGNLRKKTYTDKY